MQECLRQAAVASPSPPSPVGTAAIDTSQTTPDGALPTWRIGDEWAYRYDAATGAGTFVWSVVRSEVTDGHDCYVLKVGKREIFYRKSDLASVRETVSGVVVRRNVPPRLHYRWPLVVGRKWDHSFVMENWRDKQTTETAQAWEIVAVEQVTVPAGTFQTYKIVSRYVKTGRTIYERWYAPSVKQWVKIHEWPQAGERTREMIAYKIQ